MAPGLEPVWDEPCRGHAVDRRAIPFRRPDRRNRHVVWGTDDLDVIVISRRGTGPGTRWRRTPDLPQLGLCGFQIGSDLGSDVSAAGGPVDGPTDHHIELSVGLGSL
ncbi:hypothetical protein GCM10009546_06100 [Actinomadura livida]|uniref:Uncharacterized protein n=1 Tax=Actinomadura livida TaxID=79909 RepID=A0ABP3NP14_9ACTN|nr:hypothetical protein GCM10010208_54920 [Actinomadura livida]